MTTLFVVAVQEFYYPQGGVDDWVHVGGDWFTALTAYDTAVKYQTDYAWVDLIELSSDGTRAILKTTNRA